LSPQALYRPTEQQPLVGEVIWHATGCLNIELKLLSVTEYGFEVFGQKNIINDACNGMKSSVAGEREINCRNVGQMSAYVKFIAVSQKV
jgi:hypothetical protein